MSCFSTVYLAIVCVLIWYHSNFALIPMFAVSMVRASGGGYSYSNLYAEEDQLRVDSSKLVTRDDGSPAVKMDGVCVARFN